MTRLAVEAEIIKLAHILGVSQTQLNFLNLWLQRAYVSFALE